MAPPSKDYVFNNWTEAAKHAKGLMDRGEIDMDEYGKILARAKNEQGNSALGQAPAQQGQAISGSPQAQPPSDPMNGRALPVQSLPTWDQIQRFFGELMGPRPAH